MSSRRSELTRQAARLFAQKGYHGTSVGDLAQALGVQKGSLYSHIESKADLLWEVASEGAAAFHAALDAVPDEGPVVERIRAALRAHLRVVAEQLDVATVFVREWRYLEGGRGGGGNPPRRRPQGGVCPRFPAGGGARSSGETRTAVCAPGPPCSCSAIPVAPRYAITGCPSARTMRAPSTR